VTPKEAKASIAAVAVKVAFVTTPCKCKFCLSGDLTLSKMTLNMITLGHFLILTPSVVMSNIDMPSVVAPLKLFLLLFALVFSPLY
jgi:hypothetical protein